MRLMNEGMTAFSIIAQIDCRVFNESKNFFLAVGILSIGFNPLL